MNLQDFINNLTQETLDEINAAFAKKNKKIPIYTFSKIKDKDIKKLFDIERIFSQDIFDTWFNSDIVLTDEEISFLQELLDREIDLISIYKEEDLKIYFISPILNKVDFKSVEKKIRGFYEENIVYKTNRFVLYGITDFVVAKGLEYPEENYFFIQEFKKEVDYSDPRPQLLSELIAAVELNNATTIKGAYIIGGNWKFVILNKLDTDKYNYAISRNFDSTKIEDLKRIYKNLLFVKKEIFK
jgi:hypothetical protein